MDTADASYAPMDVATANKMNKENIRKKNAIAFLLGFLLCAVLSAVIISIYIEMNKSDQTNCPSNYLTTSTTTTCSDQHQNAINNIHQILENSTMKYSSMTDDNQVNVENAYNTFDTDSDGFWSYDEHIVYQECLSNHTTLFDIIDYDNDTIISIRELVTYLINTKGITKDMMTLGLDKHIYDIYGFDEGIKANDTQTRSQLYHEYIADIWFKTYDKTGKGYINFNDWQYGHYNHSFDSYDINNDDKISFDEFLQQQFHSNKNASKAFRLFSDTLRSNDENIRSGLQSISQYNYDDIQGIILSVCHNNNILKQRRLISFDCVWDAAECGYDAVEAGTECSAGEVLTDGLDTLICAGKIVEVCHSCYEMYESC